MYERVYYLYWYSVQGQGVQVFKNKDCLFDKQSAQVAE